MFDSTAPQLQLDDSLYPGVLDGTITATIRIGDRPLEPGRMMFTATRAGYLPVLVYVSSVIKTTMIGLADIHAQRAGWRDAETAMVMLRDIYPEAKLDTPMTVLLFDRVV